MVCEATSLDDLCGFRSFDAPGHVICLVDKRSVLVKGANALLKFLLVPWSTYSIASFLSRWLPGTLAMVDEESLAHNQAKLSLITILWSVAVELNSSSS